MTPPRAIKLHEIVKQLEHEKWLKDQYGIESRKMYKTHCKRGHPRTDENIYPSGACKICAKLRRTAQYRVKNNLCKRGHKRNNNGTCYHCKYLRDHKLIAYYLWYSFNFSGGKPPIAFEAHPGGWKLWIEMTVGRLDGLPADTGYELEHYRVNGMTVTDVRDGKSIRFPFS